MNTTHGTTANKAPGLATRAQVMAAARPIQPLWPATGVIAVNPLLGLLDRDFEEAARIARTEMGANGFRDIDAFRADHAAGRITDRHLHEAILETLDADLRLLPIPTPTGEIEALDLLAADLIEGPAPNAPTELASAAARCDSMLGTGIAPSVDRILTRWLAAYTDSHSASWRLPLERDGFHEAARALLRHDREAHRLTGGRTLILDERPEGTIDSALDDLGITGTRRLTELRAQLLRLPGWAGWIKWRTEWAAADTGEVPIDLVELAAVRIALEAAAVEHAVGEAEPGSTDELRNTGKIGAPRRADDIDGRLSPALARLGIEPNRLTGDAKARALATLARLGDVDRLSVWLRAHEIAYRDGLLGRIDNAERRPLTGRPSAQAVFCIDVRSEGMRRHLEALSDCETLGFAGFFAVAVRFRELGAGGPTDLCPVLLSPSTAIEELPAEGAEKAAARALDAIATRSVLEHAFHDTKSGVASQFSLAEAGGLIAGPAALARTLSDGTRKWLRSRRPDTKSVPTELQIEADAAGSGYTPAEQVAFAHTALTMMGLTRDFGRLVMLCGHGSSTVNNPYGSGLDCGACGGNQGGPNARIAAAILNTAHVRSGLLEHGIEIPDDTVFVAAQHDTTTDSVTLLDTRLVPETHRTDVERLEASLTEAGDGLAAERAGTLPGSGVAAGRDRVAARGDDWAEIRPEWGLAGNAAFIVGDRSITEGADLGCRTFLHSYRAECDPDGSALETILTAPLVVAHWINSQYYFSSVDPDRFGAGDKTIHNVLAGRAILQGSGGDLRIGLPWQSVSLDGELIHEPLRLLAVVEAPLERIERIIADNRILQEMFGGGWVSLVARDRRDAEWNTRSRAGTWSSWVGHTLANDERAKEATAR